MLQLRVALAAKPLAVLFASSRTAMHRTLLQDRKPFKTRGIVIPPATTPPVDLAAIAVTTELLGGLGVGHGCDGEGAWRATPASALLPSDPGMPRIS